MAVKKKNILKMVISAGMATLSIMSINSTALAEENTRDVSVESASAVTRNNAVPNGISDTIGPVESLEDQFKELLMCSINSEQREKSSKKRQAWAYLFTT